MIFNCFFDNIGVINLGVFNFMQSGIGFIATQASKIPERVYSFIASTDLSFDNICTKARFSLGFMANYGSIPLKATLYPCLGFLDLSHLFYKIYFYNTHTIKGLKPEVEAKIREKLAGLIALNTPFDQVSEGTKALFKGLEQKLIQKLLESTLKQAPLRVLEQISVAQVEALFEGQIEACVKQTMRTVCSEFLSSEQIFTQGLKLLTLQAPPVLQQLCSELMGDQGGEFKLLFSTHQQGDRYTLYLFSSNRQALTFTGDEHRRQVCEFNNLTFDQLRGLQTHIGSLKGENLAVRLISFNDIQTYLAECLSQTPQVHELAQTHLFSLADHDPDRALIQQVLSLKVFDRQYEQTEAFIFSLSLGQLMAEVMAKKEQLTLVECRDVIAQIYQHRLSFSKLPALLAKSEFNQVMNDLEALIKNKIAHMIRLEQLNPPKPAHLPLVPKALWPMFDYLFELWGTDHLFLDKLSEGIKQCLGENYEALFNAARQEYLVAQGVQRVQTPQSSWYQKAFAVSLCVTVYLGVAQLLAMSIPLFIPVCGALSYYLNTQLVGQTVAGALTLGLAKLIPQEYRKIYDQTVKEVLYRFIPYAMELFYRYGVSAESKQGLQEFIACIDAHSYRTLYQSAHSEGNSLDSPHQLPEPLSNIHATVSGVLTQFSREVEHTPQTSPLDRSLAAIDPSSPLVVMSQQGVNDTVQQALKSGDKIKIWLCLLESYPTLFTLFKEKKTAVAEVLTLFSNRAPLTADKGMVVTEKDQFFDISCIVPLPPAPSLLERLQKGSSIASGFGQLFSGQIFTVIQKAIDQVAPVKEAIKPVVDQERKGPTPVLKPDHRVSVKVANPAPLSPLLEQASKQERREFFTQKSFNFFAKIDYSGLEAYVDMVKPDTCALINQKWVPHEWLRFPTIPSAEAFSTIFADLEALDRLFPIFESGDEYLGYLKAVKGLASELTRLNVRALSYSKLYATTTQIHQVLQKSEDRLIKVLAQVDLYEHETLHSRFLKDLSDQEIEAVTESSKEMVQLLSCMKPNNFFRWHIYIANHVINQALPNRCNDLSNLFQDMEACLRAIMMVKLDSFKNEKAIMSLQSRLSTLTTPVPPELLERLKQELVGILQQEKGKFRGCVNQLTPEFLNGSSLLVAALYLGVAEYLMNNRRFLVGFTPIALGLYFRKAPIETVFSAKLKEQQALLIAFCQKTPLETHGIIRALDSFFSTNKLVVNVFDIIQGHKEGCLEAYLRGHARTDDDLRALKLMSSLEKTVCFLTEDAFCEIDNWVSHPSHRDDFKFLNERETLLPRALSHLHKAFTLMCIDRSSTTISLAKHQQLLRWDVKPHYIWLPGQIADGTPLFFGFNKTSRDKQFSPQVWDQVDRHFFEQSTVKFKNPFGLLNETVWFGFLVDRFALIRSSPCPLATFVGCIERGFVGSARALDRGSSQVLANLDSARALFQDLKSAQRVLAALTKAQDKYAEQLRETQELTLEFDSLIQWCYYQAFLLHSTQVICFKPQSLTLARWFGVDPASLSEDQLDEALLIVAFTYREYANYFHFFEKSCKESSGSIKESSDSSEYLLIKTMHRFVPYFNKRVRESPQFLTKLSRFICQKRSHLPSWASWDSSAVIEDVSELPLIKLTHPSLGESRIINLEDIDLTGNRSFFNKSEACLKQWIMDELGLEAGQIDSRSNSSYFLSRYELYIETQGLTGEIFKIILGDKWLFKKVLGQGELGYLFIKEGGCEVKVFDRSLRHEKLSLNLRSEQLSQLVLLPHAPYLFKSVQNAAYPHRYLLESFALCADIKLYQPVTDQDTLMIELKKRGTQDEIVSFNLKGGKLTCLQAGGMSLSLDQTLKAARVLGPYLVLEHQGEKKSALSTLIYRSDFGLQVDSIQFRGF